MARGGAFAQTGTTAGTGGTTIGALDAARSAAAAAVSTSPRPTPAELAAAKNLIDCFISSGINRVGNRTATKVVACAVALYAGEEEFDSDRDAKAMFGVSFTTDVRQRWVSRLEQLEAVHRRATTGTAVAIQPQSRAPVNASGAETQAPWESTVGESSTLLPTPPLPQLHRTCRAHTMACSRCMRPSTDCRCSLPCPFTTCQHTPKCKNTDQHATAIIANEAARRQRWREKQPGRPFCGHRPPCTNAQEHKAKLASSRIDRADRRRQQRPRPDPLVTRVCDGCNKWVCGGNFFRGSAAADGSGWNCERCLRAYERTHRTCIDCSDQLPAWLCRHGLRCPECFGAKLDELRAMQGQCEGTTLKGRRCRVTRESRHADAEPLRQGGRFCAHHMQYDEPPIFCGAMTVRNAPCKVHSRLSWKDARPLRYGSPFCHHHRKQCEGFLLFGQRCCVTSSSEHEHAAPLRCGMAFCAHHASQAHVEPEERVQCQSAGEYDYVVHLVEYCQGCGSEEHLCRCSQNVGYCEGCRAPLNAVCCCESVEVCTMP